mmetsp:Transcript_98730/g.235255  ORF Transcript_98730/g.235255 Transcript_98730/m.235255 type:complete len:364 (+) Transcript_98730:62-1153(+)
MRSVCIVLGLVVALGNSLQETPEDNDGQCLLSKKRVARMPNVDMLASSAHSKARAQHTSVLQKGAERSDPLDRIDWDQQLHEYRMVADDVAPVDKKNRCPLRRMDAQKVRDEELDNLDKPAILTNVFDPNEHWTSDLSKAELLDRYGDFELYDSAFDHLGAGAFLRDHIDDVETVEDATKANQPGNLIFFEDEVADKMVTKILKSVTENLPEDSRYVVLPKDTEGTWENRGVSFGHRGQWNQMHIHNRFIFTQILGSKGWVMSPAQAFPEDAEDRHSVIPITHPAMCSPFFKRDQKHSYAPHKLGVEDYIQNQTEAGVECVLHAGEALYVPGHTYDLSWWHGTCDLGDWNAGVTSIFHTRGKR